TRGSAIFDPAARVLEELGGVGQVELLLQLGLVGLDGLDAQVQVAGDLAGALSEADHLEDLELPVAQAADRLRVPAGPGLDGRLNEAVGNAAAQVEAAFEHAADRDLDLGN